MKESCEESWLKDFCIQSAIPAAALTPFDEDGCVNNLHKDKHVQELYGPEIPCNLNCSCKKAARDL